MDEYQTPLKEVLTNLKTSKQGLTTAEAKHRLDIYGSNVLVTQKGDGAFKIFLNQFTSPIVWILIGAVIVSALLGEFVDAGVILVILILNAILGFYQEFRAEKAIEALKNMAAPHANVLRDGEIVSIAASKVVPGDILILQEGDKVVADARLIESTELRAQESSLTGESTSVSKKVCDLGAKLTLGDQVNTIFSGTLITKGHARAVIYGTGMKTEMGKIAHMLSSTETSDTPLQKQLASFSKWLGIATLAVCFIVFLSGVLQGHEILETLLIAVALAVAAIPEGLPAVVTVSLALGVKRMIKKNALIRKLPSVETLGSTTVICSDKTGTLTHNQMTVRKLWVDGKIIQVYGSGYDPKNAQISDNSAKLLLEIGALNNSSTLNQNDWSITGDPTEACLLTSALKGKLDLESLSNEREKIGEIPFSSETKTMKTLHKVGKSTHLYVKGAVDVIVEECDYIYKQGRRVRLTREAKKQILIQNESFAKDALRVLGFAYKEGAKKVGESDGLVFVGMQAMIDPPREEVKGSIVKCHEAGIKVVMITGDHKITAFAIASELGIVGDVVSGSELDEMSDDELIEKVKTIGVYARVNPEHKMRIVSAFQHNGETVAMTGDGVNDAPALKRADIGIAMGISGTEVAKEASEMILTDDNFTSIVGAVEEGRSIFDNIRKFVNYLLAYNFSEILVIFIAGIAGFPLPLIAIQILWINLVTDGLPAVALAMDEPNAGIMKKSPKEYGGKIMDTSMIAKIIFIGVLMAFTVLLVFRYALTQWDLITARTVAFTTLVFLELVGLQIIRSGYQEKLFSNKYLLYAVALSLFLHLVVLYTPLSNLFEVVPLVGVHWLAVGIATISSYISAVLINNYVIKRFYGS